MGSNDEPNDEIERRDVLKGISAGAAVFGSVGLGSTSVAGEMISEETDVSILDYQRLDENKLDRDQRLVRRHGVVRKFESEFAKHDLAHRSISGFKVITDDEEVNGANPRILMLGYAEEDMRTARDELPDGNTGVIVAYVEDQGRTSRVASASPFIAEELPDMRNSEERTYQVKTFKQPTDGPITAEDNVELQVEEQDRITVSKDELTASEVGTDNQGDLINYICAGTCVPMVSWICEKASGRVSKTICVRACWRFVTNPALLGACGGVCLLMVDFINDRGCGAGAGTICAAFCSNV